MPNEYNRCTYSVKRNGSQLADGWRLRQFIDGKQVKTSLFTPNGGWDTADQLAEDKAHDTGKQWLIDHNPDISF